MEFPLRLPHYYMASTQNDEKEEIVIVEEFIAPTSLTNTIITETTTTTSSTVVKTPNHQNTTNTTTSSKKEEGNKKKTSSNTVESNINNNNMVVNRVLSSKVSTMIPIEARSILIGSNGRNVSLIGKYSRSFLQCSDAGEVTLVPRSKDSDLELGKRMIQAVVAGGILRWFLHPGITNKYYHVSVRAQLQALTASLTKDTCALQLLRAHKGHLCLFVMPLYDGKYDLIKTARPELLMKIAEFANNDQNTSNDEPDNQHRNE